MSLSATEGPPAPMVFPTGATSRGGIFAPPGLLFYVAVAVAIVVALDANSRASLGILFIAFPIWVLLAGIWFLRFLGALSINRLRLPVRHWVRWLAVPILMGAVFVLTRYNVPFDVRLAASRGAMDVAAAEVAAGGSTDRSWIGLYAVEGVERIPGGMRFIIDDSGLGTIGFAYSSEGQPVSVDDDPLWCCDSYEPLGGGWWAWFQEWD